MKKPRNIRRIITYVALGLLGVVCVTGVALAVTVAVVMKNLPSTDEINSRQISQSTKIYDRTGETLLYEIHGEEKRTIVSYDEIPQVMKQATIAIEDQSFYTHQAFDWRGIMRAIVSDIIHLRLAQGGSTITQQLAKKAFLSDEKTISRKVKELLLAFRLEKQYSKDQILNLYLNQIPYGANAYGVEAAAQTYFGVHVKDITLAEAAALASLPQAPTYYSPWGSNLDALLRRKNIVLDQMLKMGAVSQADHDKAKAEKLKFLPQATKIKAPHFVIAVQDYLIDKYGNDALENGGLKVITTLDWDLQQYAEKAVTDGAKRNAQLYKGKNAALFAEDPATGQVLALVGSHDYFDTDNEGNFNVATQGLRQPGSSFKPFAYITAFEHGYTPQTMLFDLPTEFDTTGNPARSYRPQNFDNQFRGPITMKNALAQSINIPAVKTMYLAGIDDVLKTAKDFGITTLTERSRYGLSLVLGGGEVKLSEMVGAYSVFATEGTHHDQTYVLRIEDSKGAVLEEYDDKSQQVIDAQYTRLINDILSDVSARAPLFESSLNLTTFGDRDVALKTGTTNNYVDAWAMGYTPSIVAGVWAGNNHREPLQKKGGSILAAVPIWSDFMKKALDKYPAEFFTKPDPQPANKPVLNGDYTANKQIHTILYYVNKDDPQGPPPTNPENDPQFANWDVPVQAWARQNLPDYDTYNQAVTSEPVVSGAAPITVQITDPQNGAYVKDLVHVHIETGASEELNTMEVALNGVMLDRVTLSGTSTIYDRNFNMTNLDIQNELIATVTTKSGRTATQTRILYKTN